MGSKVTVNIIDITGLEHRVVGLDSVFLVNDKTYGEPYEIAAAEDGTKIMLINVGGIAALTAGPYVDNA